jgi:4-hydroxybenzoate polyprenyltransferase
LSIIKNIKDWLRIFRAQTAAAVLMIILVPYLVGGGDFFSWYTLILAIWSIMVHHVSFGHNTIMDTLMGWDKKDVHKTHHPLISSKIKKETALKVISIGVFFTTLIGIYLVYKSPGNQFLAMSFFSLFIIGGMIYNSGISKASRWDVLPISLSFTSLSLFSYFLVAQDFNLLIILVALYIIFLQWFEIGVEGEIKEIEIEDEVNMLKLLGTKCDGKTFDMGISIIYPWILKLIGLSIAGYIIYKFTYEPLTIVLFAIFGIMAIYFCYELTKKRKWDRKKAVRDMALEEVMTIFLLPLILIPLVGLLEVVIILVVTIFYFVGMNSLLWETRFAPRV